MLADAPARLGTKALLRSGAQPVVNRYMLRELRRLVVASETP
jgi:hypothetical protein